MRSLPYVLALCGLFSAPCVLPGEVHAQTAPNSASANRSYTSDPKFQAAMAEGAQLARRYQFSFAADSYKKANKIAGGQCLACLKAAYTAQIEAGRPKDAVSSAEMMEGVASTATDKSGAKYLQANALFLAAGDKPKPEKLAAVQNLLTQALSLSSKNAGALFLQGKVFASMGRMEEAKAAFAQCLSCVSPDDPARFRAEHFAHDPELALHKMAPPFKVTALNGTEFNLDAMKGKVVLIDFWATWCHPCVGEIPHVKRLAQEFAGQPLVILSVSWDADEAKWKEFLGKNEMTWLQYRDSDHKLAEAFEINSIPHYFTIDSDGVLTAEIVGSGSDLDSRLRKLVAKAREAQRETVARTADQAAAQGSN